MRQRLRPEHIEYSGVIVRSSFCRRRLANPGHLPPVDTAMARSPRCSNCRGDEVTENRPVYYVQQNPFTARFAGHQNIDFRYAGGGKRNKIALEVTLAIRALQIRDFSFGRPSSDFFIGLRADDRYDRTGMLSSPSVLRVPIEPPPTTKQGRPRRSTKIG